jgi:predicted nucleic acid-binding protein
LGLILDSSILIAGQRLGQTAHQILERLAGQTNDQEIALSVVTVSELAHGISRANTRAQRALRLQFLEDLLAGIPVHPVNTPIAFRTGALDGTLQAKGVRVALADLLIGATALELGYSVLTHNVRHFRLIPELEVQQHP